MNDQDYQARKALSVQAAAWCWCGMVAVILFGWTWSFWA